MAKIISAAYTSQIFIRPDGSRGVRGSLGLRVWIPVLSKGKTLVRRFPLQ
jgi:hypothetical protein